MDDDYGDEGLSDEGKCSIGFDGLSDEGQPAEKKQRRAPSAEAAEDDQARTRANRDRNREHARNTRLRKKAYVENLKRTVQELSAQVERVDRDRRAAASIADERAEVRKQVLQTLFYYRAVGELDRGKWVKLLDESCTFTLPITPYRSYSASEVINNQRVVVGIDGMINDTASLRVLVQSIGRKSRRGDQEVEVRFYSGPEDIFLSGDALMCRWLMRTENAVACGAACECYKRGMLKASFSDANKITTLEIGFDVMSFMLQLLHAADRDAFETVPNTLPNALQPSADARVITTVERPHKILWVNEPWEEMCGYSSDEACGQTLAMLQGPATDSVKIAKLMAEISERRPSSMVVTNYRKDGTPFNNYVRVYPLAADGVITRFLGVLERVDDPDQVAAAHGAVDAAEAARKRKAAACASTERGAVAATTAVMTAATAAAAADAAEGAASAGALSFWD